MNVFQRLALSSTLALGLASVSFAQHYTQTNLQTNAPGVAEATDPQLVNSSGMARTSGSLWWVSDNVTGVATLYNGPGTPTEIAEAYLFLMRGTFTTGQTVIVDGGMLLV
jgi:NAD(P)-dependent dehydrogenase (short-subunit alcohol dehydrogenase family)